MSADRPVLLMVDDDPGLRRQFKWSFEQYEVVTAADRDEAIAMLRRFMPDVVTLDLGLPPEPDTPEEGFETLAAILAFAPATRVIALTGQNDRANALRAIAAGACDFVEKPFDAALLGVVIDRAFRLASLERENRRLAELAAAHAVPGFLTGDPAVLKVCRQVEKLASSDVSVLLSGESGTGKEILARALHDHSPRRGRRFVAVNCAAIPENLLESELFGYERGAFTGAVRQTIGKIEYAHGGTFFLDEVGDLPLTLQAKLLRFLQERVVERLGGRQEIPVDVRVVCATHRNLRQAIASGTFREDLYYRLAEFVLSIPPLRERSGDALLIARALLQRQALAAGTKPLKLRPDAVAAIEKHPWPGNVRELENCVKRAGILAEGDSIGAVDLGLPNPVSSGGDNPNSGAAPKDTTLKQIRDAAERDAIIRALARTDGNISEAAELLGVSRPTLYALFSRHGIR